MKIYGVVGYKNAGKTGLMERLVIEISQRGHSVSTIKHAHHSFDVDQPQKDSYRHRIAGAQQVLLASKSRWAGYKRDAHPKIEAFRADANNPLIAPDDPTIRAIASDTPHDIARPVFDLDDTTAIASFILSEIGL
mgnify:CR=1 FL=1